MPGAFALPSAPEWGRWPQPGGACCPSKSEAQSISDLHSLRFGEPPGDMGCVEFQLNQRQIL
jgi:hypothetical protein